MTLNTGLLLNNRYRIVKLLGQGGFGAVYRAWDINLERPRALKENLDTSPEAQRQFKREAQILSDLTHPHLPKVIDHFVIPDQGQYLVMEYIEGQDLQSLLDANPGTGLPENQVLPWIIQVCDALEYMHSQNPPVIHRDIKPANIKITPQGNTYLVDFGIAKLYDPTRRTTQGARSVTPGYAPFEQYGQSPTDARSDIYALGATLYHLVTGRTPPDSIERIRGISLPLPRGLNPAISPALEAILLKALDVMPENRYQSMAELHKALQSCMIGGETGEPAAQTVVMPLKEPVAATVASPAPAPAVEVAAGEGVFEAPPAAKKRPTRLWIGIGGLALVVVLLVGGYFLFQSFNGDEQTGIIEPAPQTPTTLVLPTEAPTAAVQPSEVPAKPEQPAEKPFICTDSIGCIEIPPRAPIHIAFALVISGPDATLGIDSRNGAELAIDDRGGKLLGHPILFNGVDEHCSASGGEEAGVALSSDPTIVAILGTSCSSALRTAMPYWSKAGFTVVSPSNTAVDLTQPGSKNNFPGYLRTAHNDIVQGAAAARFARQYLGVKKAATIHDGSIYSQQLQQVFADTFVELGGEITAQEPVDPNQTDMSGVLTIINPGAPELIYHPVFIQVGSEIVRQARQTPGLENTYLMGADGMFSPTVVEGLGEAVEGLFVSSPDYSKFGSQYWDRFLPMYREKYKVDNPLSVFHAHAYDAMNMIFTCIEKVAAQPADGLFFIGRQALRECMYSMKGFPGLTGRLSCNRTGDCADSVIGVYEYHKNAYPPTQVWP